MKTGPRLQCPFLHRSGVRAAQRDKNEILIQFAQLVKSRQTTLHFFAILFSRVNIQQDCHAPCLACPPCQVLEVRAQYHLEPWNQFRNELIEKLLISCNHANDRQSRILAY